MCHDTNRRQRASRERRPRCVEREPGGRTAEAAAFTTQARVHESFVTKSLATLIMNWSVRPHKKYGSFKCPYSLTNVQVFKKRSP